MAKESNPDREKIRREFETMKSFELSARDMYSQIANDSQVTVPKIRQTFARLANDEQRHADLAQQILDLLDRTL